MKPNHTEPNMLLTQARLALGLSQDALARHLGVSLKALWRWENGQARPYPRHRFLLCAFFHKTAKELGLDPVDTAFPELASTALPERAQIQAMLEEQKNNPTYFREYQAYLQHCQQINPLHQCAVSFCDWFLVAHPEQALACESKDASDFNKLA